MYISLIPISRQSFFILKGLTFYPKKDTVVYFFSFIVSNPQLVFKFMMKQNFQRLCFVTFYDVYNFIRRGKVGAPLAP